MNPRFLTLAGMILAAALSRLAPHPWNFSPVAAMALFAGAHFENPWHAALVPVGALLVSDVFLGFYPDMPFVYGAFLVNVLLGRLLMGRRSPLGVATASAFGSLQFFFATNFGVWAVMSMYPKDFSGLMACYVAALPFFRMTFLGDLFYTAILFGSFVWLEKKFPHLLEQPA